MKAIGDWMNSLMSSAAVLGLAVHCMAGSAWAREKPATSPETAPDVYSMTSQFKRVVVVRIKNQVDMFKGLRDAVARERIQNAVILTGAGSLASYHVHVVSNTTLPATEAFFKGEGPFDLIATTGYVIDGRVHCHVTFSNTGKAMGGHLEPGTRVFTFAIITLGVLDDSASLKRMDDQTWR